MTDKNSKKEISVNPKIVSYLLLSLVIGFIALFAIEHAGKISFIMGTIPPRPGEKMSLTAEAPPEYPVSIIYFDTPFDSRLQVPTKNWKNEDVYFKSGDFHKYGNLIKVYFQAVKTDYLYGLLFSGIMFLLIVFFMKFKIKIKKDV